MDDIQHFIRLINHAALIYSDGYIMLQSQHVNSGWYIIHTRTQARTYTHARAHTHTHTRTHAHIYIA